VRNLSSHLTSMSLHARRFSSPRPRGLCVKSLSPLLSASLLLYFLTSLFVSGCSHSTNPDPSSLTFLIESNPTNLDPRFATDAQSLHIGALLFSSLLQRDDQMNLHGDLAESWDVPNPLTYVFHLRRNVRFHDGRPVNSADVKATFEFIMDPANRSPKRGAFRMVTSIEAPTPPP
jgi:peptide/nickel transport system substrate-binding protein